MLKTRWHLVTASPGLGLSAAHDVNVSQMSPCAVVLEIERASFTPRTAFRLQLVGQSLTLPGVDRFQSQRKWKMSGRIVKDRPTERVYYSETRQCRSQRSLVSPIPETRPSLIVRLSDVDDVDAWDEFVTIYGPLVYRVARHRGLQHSDAQDLVQEVCLRYLGRSMRGRRIRSGKSFALGCFPSRGT